MNINTELERFSFFVPAEVKKGKSKDGVEEMRIKGIASSSSAEDSDGETLDPSGFDVKPLLAKGFLNWDHSFKKNPSAIVGQPDVAKIINGGRDLYIEGFLYPDSTEAQQIYKLAQVLEANSPDRRLGFSIEGQVIERGCGPQYLDKAGTISNPSFRAELWAQVKKARITGMAITPCPKNPNTLMQVMKSETAHMEMEKEYDEDFIEKAMSDDFEGLEKGGRGSGKYQHHKRSKKSGKEKKFKTSKAAEDSFFKIKDRVMKDYGYKDLDDEGYEEDEDNIMRDANKIFQEKYGYEHYIDAVEDAEDFKKSISAEGLSAAGALPEDVENCKNPNKIPLNEPGTESKKAMGTGNTPGFETVEKAVDSTTVGNLISKSEVYNLIANRYTTDVVKAKQIFSLIENVNTKLFNMNTPITAEAIQKAFDFLDQASLSKSETGAGETAKLEDETKKAEKEAELKKAEDDKKEKEEKEKVEKAECTEENMKKAKEMCKGFMAANGDMTKGEMIDGLKKAGFGEATVTGAVESVISEANAEKDGGKITQESFPVINKGEESLILKSFTETTDLLKSFVHSTDKKFSSLGVLLKASTEQNVELKEQLDSLQKSNSALNKRLGIVENTPMPSKSITKVSAAEKFEKSVNAEGQEGKENVMGGDDGIFDLTKAEDRSALGERMYADFEVSKEKGTPNTMLEKAIMDLEISKSLPQSIIPYLRANKIKVRLPK